MSLGELLVILVVSVVVFGPNKLPMVAKHLGLAMRQLNRWKSQWQTVWQNILLAQQLEENQQKAKAVDDIYLQQNRQVMQEVSSKMFEKV